MSNERASAAILSSLVASCRRLEINPFAYLHDVFVRISDTPISQLGQLLADRWQATTITVTDAP